MKLYLTEQQEKSLRELSMNESLAKQATLLYLKGVFDAAGMEATEASLSNDEIGAYLDIPEKDPDGPEAMQPAKEAKQPVEEKPGPDPE